MGFYMEYLIVAIIGYLIGSIQIPIIAGKVVKKIDIRDYGSGNAGSTNVARVLGLKVAIVVFILDICKGVVPFLIAQHFFNTDVASVLGVATVIGHDFPIFMNFKGGKGVAISVGIIIAYNPVLGISILLLGITTVAITKYVSLASVSGAILVFIYMLFSDASTIQIISMDILVFLLIFQHRGNIKRLIKGEENKLTFKKSE